MEKQLKSNLFNIAMIIIITVFCIGTYMCIDKGNEVYAQKSKIEYYGDYFYKTVSGYAGNQKASTKFSTGGGFYWSDKGGPSASVSVSLGSTFGSVSVGTTLGNSTKSGKFVNVPSKSKYYRLYVEKKLKLRKYKVYVWKWSPAKKKYCWCETSRNVKKFGIVSMNVYAKQK